MAELQKKIVVALFSLSILVSACAAESSFDQPNEDVGSLEAFPDELPEVDIEDGGGGTNGELIVIESDNVARAGYDSESLTMIVEFNQGRLYEYYSVPIDLWERFVAAQPDPWSLVGYPELVGGGYAYMEVTP
jgi:hypothetical protein